jgi:NADH:ubiquinone oxidoreductase subunit C
MKYLISFEKKATLLKFVKNISLTIPKFFNKIEIIENDSQFFEIVIYISSAEYLIDVLSFFKYNTQSQFEQLIDIVAIDCLNLKEKEFNNSFRFKIFYQLLSLRFNRRFLLCVSDIKKLGLNTSSKIYFSANWVEREIWDMFGIFFWEHSDLRRILTDYGFKGFPLRKDFPLSGFSEVRYDDEIKLVFYEPIELAQEFRLFDSLNPWIKY